MIDSALVSVVVPVFNTGSLVIDFIKSIIAQTYTKWELLLIDDGSDESTLNYIESIKKMDSRIFLFKRDRQPKGSLTCRNIGMLHSKGQYIIHFDADDLVEPFCLEQRVLFMEENPSLEYAVFKGASFYSDGDSKIHIINHRWGRKRHQDDIISFLSNDYPFSIWNCIYRSSVFKDLLWDENVKIYTDFSYILPILMTGYKYDYSIDSREDYLYRVNQKNAMTSSFISEEKYKSTLYLFNKTQELILSSPQRNVHKKAFKKYYIIQLERILNTKKNDFFVDFKFFYEKFYGKELRMMILTFVNEAIIKKMNLRNRKIVRFFIAFLYNPLLFKKWIISLNKHA